MNVSYLSQLHNAINKKDFLTIKELFSPNVVIDFPGFPLVRGRSQAAMFFRLLLGRFEFLRFEIVDVIVSTDRACVVWENFGEQSSGKKYTNRGITFILYEGSQIILLSDYFKDTSFWLSTNNKN